MSYKETIEAKNVFYFSYINTIGGVETFFYNLARKYKNYDILILYSSASDAQIKRLMKYVRVEKFVGQDILCDKAFFNYSVSGVIDHIKANEYIQIIHADYAAQGLKPSFDKKITRYLCVSETVRKSFESLTGLKAELAYNPVAYIRPRRILKLISATRLTKEKGRNRIIKLAQTLHQNGIPFEWTIYTNDKNPFKDPSIFYKDPILNICDQIAASDYLVQLSDTESYCYSVVEALSMGVPVIVTPIPVFEEIGVIDKVNGFYVPFDMNDIPVKEIYEKKLKFTYRPIQDQWKDILSPGKSPYQEELRTKVNVVAIMNYYDVELLRTVKKDEILLVSKIRAKQLVKSGVAEIIEADDIDAEETTCCDMQEEARKRGE